MFKQPLWMISVAHIVGVLSVVLGVYLLVTGTVSALWVIPWILFHVLSSLMVSVGLHRYFSHGAFKTSKFWHNFMALYSVLLVSGSPQGWATAHNAHHIHSDTDLDPHISNWTYLVWKRYKQVPMPMRRLKALAGDPVLAFVHRYGMPLLLGFILVLAFISPLLLLYGYLMPLGTVHLIGGIHQVISHKNLQPRNLALLEFIFPACGEWLHKTHHDFPGRKNFRTKWWHPDLGALFISWIETPQYSRK